MRTGSLALFGIIALTAILTSSVSPAAAWTPTFSHPPTPTCGTTLTIVAGSKLTFTVKATDSISTALVNLTVTGMPVGATMTPPLPTTGNPVSSTFNWTPTTGQVGSYTVTFKAALLPPNQGLYSTCKIYIHVSTLVIPEFPVGTVLGTLIPLTALILYTRRGLLFK